MLKTITLTGAETSVNLGIIARNIRIENRGSDTVYASAKSGFAPKTDGVLTIGEGETKTLHDLSGSVLYLLGNGEVEIEASDVDFSTGGKGGGGNADNYLLKAGGTMTGTLTAANADIGVSAVRNIAAGTANADTSNCPVGAVYLKYE